MKKAFTMIELMVVVAIVAVLSIVLLPKATQAMAKAKQTGTDKNQQFLEGMVRTTLDKHYYSAPTAEEVVQRTYTQLSKNEEVVNLTNPFDKTRKGIGLIEGDTFTDTNKAAYIFTDTPNLETLPDGTAYVLVKDARLVSNIPQEEPQEPGELTMVTVVEKPFFSLAIGNDGNLYAWGKNDFGYLGTGDKLPRETPTLLTLPEGVKPVSIEVGDKHSMVLGTDGNVYTWGANDWGQLGTGDNVYRYTPTLVSLPGNVKFKTATTYDYHTIAIGTDGNIYTWGINNGGLLGVGDELARSTPTLVTLASGVKPVSIATCGNLTATIGDDGNLYTWGRNYYGQLGTGDNTDRTAPTKITLPGGAKPKSVTVGWTYTEVITTTGETITFGMK